MSQGLDEHECNVCGEEVKNKGKAMCCDICLEWIHLDCIKVTQTIYSTIKKINGIKWMCEGCDRFFGKIGTDLKEMRENYDKLERKNEGIEKKIDDISSELVAVKLEMQELLKEKNEGFIQKDGVVEEIGDIKIQLGNLESRYSNAVKSNSGQGTSPQNNLSSRPAIEVQAQFGELWEREKRKNNLVIFGIEETNDQQVTKDKVNDIVRIAGVDTSKVKYFGRVGRLVAGAKARVVRVVCEDGEIRRNLLKGATKLKLELGYERVYISPDLTKEQQAVDKDLRVKLKEIRQQHKEAKINKNEIIIMDSGVRKVLYPVKN